MMRTALPRAVATLDDEPAPPLSIGTSSTIATTARSWKIKTPSEAPPLSVFVACRSIRSFITIAVEESATRNPVKTPVRQSTSNSKRTPVTKPIVSPTCSPPPTKMSR
jgi:hypothetical protein